MRNRIVGIAAAVLIAATAAAAAGDVVVVRGGAKIPIRGPILRRGETVLLTRTDGTLLSLPVSEVDFKATAVASAAPPAPRPAPAIASVPETPAAAARANRERPKARVRLTDADVAHQLDLTGSRGPEEKKEGGGGSGPGRVEIADYDQQQAGEQLLVSGTLRNPGASSATNVRLTVTALDEKSQTISSTQAVLANVLLEPGRTAPFSARLSPGQVRVAGLRFAPQWLATAPAASSGAGWAAAANSGEAPEASAPRTAAPPAPSPAPYGRGLLYAAPPPPASFQPPADGKTGYIPGASSPENQPKVPQ